MRKLILFFVLGWIVLSCSMQNRHLVPTEVEEKPTYTFPDDWMGYWEGSLAIYNVKGKVQEIPMAIDNAYTDTAGVYTWALIYGEDLVEGRRDYELRTVNDSIGHYVVDEKNNIYLDTYLLHNRMISTFDVEGTTITSIYELDGDDMIFTILAGKSDVVRESGGGTIDDDEIPIVNSFATTALQVAKLKKRSRPDLP